MNQLVNHDSNITERALATAQWAKPEDVESLSFRQGDIWTGRAADQNETPIGFFDDRHTLIVAGSRSGKGTSAIIPNLCFWPGSIVVIDPKGENASITAARRATGSEYCQGLDQRTFVLDPFKASNVDDHLRASFNPLDTLDPFNEESVDDASRIADALIVSENATDPFWDDQARTLLKGLILHVISSDDFEGKRNLISVRQLITSGDVYTRKVLEDLGEENIPTSFELLFEGMRRNTAFSGIVSGTGETFGAMAANSQKTLNGVLSAAGNHTEFIDSIPMQRQLAESTRGLKLRHLKDDPMGVSLFLSLPQRFMNTHFRWLRMMVSLIITEMEKNPGQPQSGHPILLILDEFAGLKKMDIIENAAAQIAGFGVKMCFIVQQLTQLKNIYKDNWEIFIGNSGAKLFFGIDDQFTREYISKQLGETEVTRTTRNQNQSHGRSQTVTRGSSYTSGTSTSSTSGGSSGTSFSSGSGTSSDIGLLWNTAKTTSSNSSVSFSSGSNWSSSSSSSYSSSDSHSFAEGYNQSESSGTSESIHKRALLTPDEIGLVFSRIDEKENPAYPGLALAVASGKRPIIVRRTNYFDDLMFEGTFDPHPDHGFKKIEPKKQELEIIPPKRIDEELIDTYGLENFQKACSSFQKIRRDYPHLKILSIGEVEFAQNILASAQKSIDIAAADGRPHTMSETLEICESMLGNFLIQNPNYQNIPDITISYGDEGQGRAAQNASEKKTGTQFLIALPVSIVAGLFGWGLFEHWFGGLVGFGGAMWFFAWLFDWEEL
jgi:type IV secretory pathway TraG/TraD family ATPase VirD4